MSRFIKSCDLNRFTLPTTKTPAKRKECHSLISSTIAGLSGNFFYYSVDEFQLQRYNCSDPDSNQNRLRLKSTESCQSLPVSSNPFLCTLLLFKHVPCRFWVVRSMKVTLRANKYIQNRHVLNSYRLA
jgi:hypothetical protein